MGPVKSTKKYICSFCARSFSRSEHKLRHERSHTNTKPFTCTLCNTSFVRRDLMQRHLRNVHKIDSASIKANGSSPSDAVAAAGSIADHPMTDAPAVVVLSPTSSASSRENSRRSSLTNSLSSLNHIPKENNDVTQLLTLSKSHRNLQISLESHIPILFFLYGTSEIPIEIDDSNIYAALCYSASFLNLNDCFKLFHKALSQPNLKSLSILAWTYVLNYDSLNKNLIPIDVIFTQLDSMLLSNPEQITFDCWFIYNIQAKYVLKFNKQPPLSHERFFLSKEVEGKPLSEWLKVLSKSSSYLPSHESLSTILNCLIMELQNLKFNANHTLTKIESHNAIIMFNKFYISKLIQFGNSYNDLSSTTSNSQFAKIFMISKRHILLNVPQTFQDLIIDYVLTPFDSTHVSLLHLTLREFQYWNSIQPLKSISTELNFDSLSNWFDNLKISTINNNLGLISYPLIVLGSLPLDLSDLKKSEFKDFVLESFLMLIKIFVERKKIDDFDDNVVLKGIVYLLFEMSNETTNSTEFTNEVLIVEKLFKILKNWLRYYDMTSLDADLERLKSCLVVNTSESHKLEGGSISSSSSPNPHSPIFNEVRHSSISSTGADNFSIITSPPSGMANELPNNNYSYFSANNDVKIKLPPLNIPKSDTMGAFITHGQESIKLPFVSVSKGYTTH